MSIRTAATVVSALAGIGSTAGGIAYHAASSAAPSVAPTATTVSSAAPACDDGRWDGPDGINVEGRPDHFDAGDSGAAYVWHDASGWHLRTTDASRGVHHYTGTITASPGASFTAPRPVRNEADDHVWVSGDGVLHYDLATYRGIDGFDVRVTACAGDREREALRFSMDYNGREQDTARIKLGDARQHPPAATFTVWRSV